MARNFYRDAPVIILGEPTSAIDALAEARIFRRLFADEELIAKKGAFYRMFESQL